MPTKKPRYTINMHYELLEKIDDFRFENRYSSRSSATVALIKTGLENMGKGIEIEVETDIDFEKPLESYSLIVDEETLKKIDDFRFENRYQNKTQATLDLIRIGLACSKNKNNKLQK